MYHAVIMIFDINNNNNMTIILLYPQQRIMLSSWQNNCKYSSGSSDDGRTASGRCRRSDQPNDWLWVHL